MEPNEIERRAYALFKQALKHSEDPAARRPFIDRADEPAEVREAALKKLDSHDRRQRGAQVAATEGPSATEGPCPGTGCKRALLYPPADAAPVCPDCGKLTRRKSFFHTDKHLGGGTFGCVYRGYDPYLRRFAAIKVLRQRDPSAARAEGRIAQLQHPGLVRVLDVFHERGDSVLVMDLIDGPTLHNWLGSNTPPERQLVELVIGLAEAVERLHAVRVVHRDIKPANVLVDGAGGPDGPQLKLVDVGAAAEVGAPGPAGTDGYMSPQCKGGGGADERDDVFSLGRTLCQMAHGAKRSRALEFVIARATDEEVGARYPTAADLRRDLERLRDGEPVPGFHGSWGGLRLWGRRSPWLAGAFAALAVSLVAGAVISGVLWARAEDNAAAANTNAGAAKANAVGWQGAAEEADRNASRAAEEQQRAERVADEKAQVLHRQLLTDGADPLRRGDTALALLRFVRAAEQLRIPAADRAVNAGRLAAVTADLPRLLWVWPSDGPIGDAAYSPDGSRVATAGGDGTVRVYSTATGEALATVTAPGPVAALAWSADGKFLASAGLLGPKTANAARMLAGDEPGAVRVWDATTWAAVGKPLESPRPGKSVRIISPQLVVATFAHELHLDEALVTWNPAEDKVLRRGERQVPWAPSKLEARAPHRLYLAEVPADRSEVRVRLDQLPQDDWREAGAEVCRIKLPEGEFVTDLAFAPDGLWLAVAGDRGTVRVHQIDTGAPVGPALSHNYGVRRVRFAPDGRHLLTVAADDAARVWDLASAAAGAEGWVQSERYHDFEIGCLSPDGKLVALVLNGNPRVVVREVATGRAVADLRLPGPVYRALFSPDGRHLITANHWWSWGGPRFESSLVRWNTATWKPDGLPLEIAEYVHEFRFDASGRCLVLGWTGDGCSIRGVYGSARVWNLGARAPLTPPLDSPQPLRGVAFSPDLTFVAVGGEDGTAQVYEAGTGKPVGPALRHPKAVNAVAFSADGAALVTGGEDHALRFWDYRAGREARPAIPQGYPVAGVELNKAGTRLAVALGRGGVRVWNPTDGRPVTAPFAEDARQVLFRDDRIVLVVSKPPQVGNRPPANGFQFWDAETGEPTTPRLGSPHGSAKLHLSGPAALLVSGAHARLVALDAAPLPVAELRLLAEALAGRRIDERGGAALLNPAEQRDRLDQLRRARPELFAPRPGAAEWHARQAALCGERSVGGVPGMPVLPDRARRWASEFHLSRAIAASVDPDPNLFARRGHLRAELGRLAEAREDCERATRAGPTPDTLCNLGALRAMSGEWAGAADAFGRAAVRPRSNHDLQVVAAAVALLRAGRPREAEQALDGFVRPGVWVPPNVFYFRGRARAAQGKFSAALSDFTVAGRPNSANNPPSPRDLNAQPELWFHRAAAHAAVGDARGTIADLGAGVALSGRRPDEPLYGCELFRTPAEWLKCVHQPGPPSAVPNDWLSETTEGTFAAHDLLPAALDHLNRAIEQNPDYWRPYFVRAGLHERSGRTDDALADYAKAAELARRFEPPAVQLLGDHKSGSRISLPDEVATRAHATRGRLYLSAGKPADALAEFDAALAASTGRAERPQSSDDAFGRRRLRLGRAHALMWLNRPAEAAAEHTAILRHDHFYRHEEELHTIHDARIACLELAGRWAEAADGCRQFLTLIRDALQHFEDQRNTSEYSQQRGSRLRAYRDSTLQTLYEASFRLRRWADAERAADDLIERTPLAHMYFQRSVVRGVQGKVTGAWADLKTAQQLAPKK